MNTKGAITETLAHEFFSGHKRFKLWHKSMDVANRAQFIERIARNQEASVAERRDCGIVS